MYIPKCSAKLALFHERSKIFNCFFYKLHLTMSIRKKFYPTLEDVGNPTQHLPCLHGASLPQHDLGTWAHHLVYMSVVRFQTCHACIASLCVVLCGFSLLCPTHHFSDFMLTFAMSLMIFACLDLQH